MSNFIPLQPLSPLPKRKSRLVKLVMLGAIIISVLLLVYAPGKLYRLTCHRSATPPNCQITVQAWRGNPEAESSILLTNKVHAQVKYGKQNGAYGARLRISNSDDQIMFSDNFWVSFLVEGNFTKLQTFLTDPQQESIELIQDERFSSAGLIGLILLLGWNIYTRGAKDFFNRVNR
jgi:hypothetical protein